MLIFLLNDQKLPWTDFQERFDFDDFEDYLKERMKPQYQYQVIEMCPQSLKPLLRKVMLLDFKDDPPYDEIISTLQEEIEKEMRTASRFGQVGH